MIVDKIKNIKAYTGLSANICKALELLKNTDFSAVKDGKYEVSDKMFYIVQRYVSQPFNDGKIEAHKKYIDVQYIASGAEIIGHAFLDDLVLMQDYDIATDCMFYQRPNYATAIHLQAGDFCVFYPHDGHMPCRYLDAAGDILKVVVKIEVN